MKEFETIDFDIEKCRIELSEFGTLLTSRPILKERDDILPFFKARKQLSSLIGVYHPGVMVVDRIAHELPLFGDFSCDLVVGDFRNSSFLFVEFENAEPESIFVKKGLKTTPEWSPRLEHGFSQIVDWFFKLRDQNSTTEFENRFGSRELNVMGLLILGRREELSLREMRRMKWRETHVIVDSKTVYFRTFDDLFDQLTVRIDRFQSARTPTSLS